MNLEGGASITALMSSVLRGQPVKRILAPLGINFSGQSIRLKRVLVEGWWPVATAESHVTIVAYSITFLVLSFLKGLVGNFNKNDLFAETVTIS